MYTHIIENIQHSFAYTLYAQVPILCGILLLRYLMHAYSNSGPAIYPSISLHF